MSTTQIAGQSTKSSATGRAPLYEWLKNAETLVVESELANAQLKEAAVR